MFDDILAFTARCFIKIVGLKTMYTEVRRANSVSRASQSIGIAVVDMLNDDSEDDAPIIAKRRRGEREQIGFQPAECVREP